MTNIYLSHFDYLRSPAGLEYQSLLGNSMRLSNAVVTGGSALPIVPSTTVALNMFDPVTIFDGSSSEVVQVASNTAAGANSIPLLQPLQSNHAQYTPACSDGVLGSLAEQIIQGSAWLEEICNQSFLSTIYTGERLSLPTTDAMIDNQQNLVLRPRNRPVTAFTALQLAWQQGGQVTFQASQAEIDTAGRIISVPVLQQSGAQSPAVWPGQPVSRTWKAWVTITYTAGYTPATMPAVMRECALLLTSNILSRRQNPTGADQINLADKQLVAVLRGDLSGATLLEKEVLRKMARYMRRAM